jgi:quercetin dioxygenase-like cupin family protein
MTLDDLSASAGVSRAMLSEIERGVKNPTIRVVSQIAAGLGCTVSELLGETPSPAESVWVTRRAERRVLLDPRSGVERHLLSPAFQARGVEVLWYSIPPGAETGEFPPHRRGVFEHITVVEGRLRCALGEEVVHLLTGDSVSFPADLSHAFRNEGTTPCRYLLIIDSSRAS